MGWLISYDRTKKQIIEERTQTTYNEDRTQRWRYPKHCVRGNCLWKIVVIEHKTEIGAWVEHMRFIALDLLRKDEGYGWGYKDIDETMGPVEVSCPLSYLDMTPPLNPEKYPHAFAWRKQVRAHHAEKQEVTKLIRALNKGDYVYLRKGCTPQRLKLVSKRPFRGTADNGGLYRIVRRMVDPARTRIHLT